MAFRKKWRLSEPTWHNAPVPSFGDSDAEVLIVGLAPGLRGANRTGRPFTGDWAGDLLYKTLNQQGFADGIYQRHENDGLTLQNIMITNAVRCVPPENKPIGEEMKLCRDFLVNKLKPCLSLKLSWRWAALPIIMFYLPLNYAAHYINLVIMPNMKLLMIFCLSTAIIAHATIQTQAG